MNYKLLQRLCNIHNRSVEGPEFIGTYFSKTINQKGKVLAVVSILKMDNEEVIIQKAEEYIMCGTTAIMKDRVAELILNEIAIKGINKIKEDNELQGTHRRYI